MDTTSRITMDWSNLQFKAKDLILFFGYIIAGVIFITKITNSIERQGYKLTDLQAQVLELKNEGKGSTKENLIFLQTLQNQVNLSNTQIRLLEQRVDMIERGLKD